MSVIDSCIGALCIWMGLWKVKSVVLRLIQIVTYKEYRIDFVLGTASLFTGFSFPIYCFSSHLESNLESHIVAAQLQGNRKINQSFENTLCNFWTNGFPSKNNKKQKTLKTNKQKSYVFISTTQRILGLAGIQIDSVSFVEQLPAVNKEHWFGQLVKGR